MSDHGRWKEINQAGSGAVPKGSDAPVQRDAQEAVDRAENASRLHEAANRLADRSGK